MGEKLVVGPINRGLKRDRTAFNIDNDSFPKLENAYQWRGRVKRKRGTSILNRLQRIIGTTDAVTGNKTVTILPAPLTPALSSFKVGSIYFTDWDPDPLNNPVQLITNSPLGESTAQLDRSTGQLIITGNNFNLNKDIIYYPGLPVMGLEDLNLPTQNYPGTIAFDTHYAYLVSNLFPYTPADISFYKNPAVDATNLPGYVPKGAGAQTPFYWNGENYQQFWSDNYQGAFWETNGVPVPFGSGGNVGMQFKLITGIAIITAGNGTTIPAVADITIVAHGLVQGDFIFVNEVNGLTGINFQTGYVTSANPQAANLVRVTFPFAILGGAWTSGGIAQYLTNSSTPTKDPLRWYDGNGWVNFCPPLSQFNYSINDTPARQYYLVGAKVIVPFKDRLLFFGAVIQASSGNPIYLQDTCCFSFNGTAFYTASFSGDPLNFTTVFRPILVPANQTGDPRNYWEDQTGFGGFRAAGIDQAITTVSTNEDALICGFRENIQTRFVYTGSDLQPFDFFVINSEYGSSSTFSVINLDEGVMSTADQGFVITAQTNCRRFDLDIPDEIFRFNNRNNGAERVTAQRDFISEWVYFSYPSIDIKNIFPNQTLFYNYRDDSWAVFVESYTTYGIFRAIDGVSWQTIGIKYSSWKNWNVPWNSGASSPLKPKVIAGNQQGYIVFREQGDTSESVSLYIQNIVTNTSTVTCTNHCLNTGDFIQIVDALGDFGTDVNGNVFSVRVVDANTFTLNPNLVTTETYVGGGNIKRLYKPVIYSRQFPVSWEMGRKTRIGMQQYMFTKTDDNQVTLLIFLSTIDNGASNVGPIIPDPASVNDGLIYNTVLFTCPESTNLGLTPANTNLLQVNGIETQGQTVNAQNQIWHRVNTSLIGDTVQFGFTLSDAQMRDIVANNREAEIEFHSAILDLNMGPWLS